MPQRAILDGTDSIAAYLADSALWAGMAAAYKAGRLRLPCCDSAAIPRVSVKGNYFFAHQPNARRACAWKKTSEQHENVVGLIARTAHDDGWEAQTEASGSGWTADVLLMRPKAGVRVGIRVELSMVDASACRAADRAMRNEDIVPLWLFTRRTVSSAPRLTNLETFANGENDEPEREIIEIISRHLYGIGQRFRNANAVVTVLGDMGWRYAVVREHRIPIAVTTTDPMSGRAVRIDIGDWIGLDIVHGGAHRDREAEIQRDLANALRSRIEEGIKLWWPGHPELAVDTFERLKRGYRQREEAVARRQEVIRRQRPERGRRATSFRVSPPGEVSPTSMPDTGLLRLAQESTIGPVASMDEWAKLRAEHIRKAAAKVMPSDEVERWMDTHNAKLGGKTPNQVAVETSQALERCEIALGLRDPVTRKPINLPSP